MLLFFLLGIAFTLCVYHGTININVHHTMQDITPKPTEADLEDAYKKMNDPDPDLDELYKTMGNISEVMEGSDRINVEEE